VRFLRRQGFSALPIVEEAAQPKACATVHGKCHREYTAGGVQHGGIAQENLRDVFATLAQFGKGEKVG
jgi:hypothetical protein